MEARHYGFASDEHAGVVLPFVSGYSRRDDCERAARRAMRDLGFEPHSLDVFPASCAEEAREALAMAAADSHGWVVLSPATLEPGADRREAAEERARREFPYLPDLQDAGRAIEALEADGIRAAYSKGGNLWVTSCPDGADLRPYGLVWSEKRGQWWAHMPQGSATPTKRTRAA